MYVCVMCFVLSYRVFLVLLYVMEGERMYGRGVLKLKLKINFKILVLLIHSRPDWMSTDLGEIVCVYVFI